MIVALYATIWLALVLLVAAEAGRGRLAAANGPSRWAWPCLAGGALLLTAHVMLALSIRYGWDHDLAVRETARQAAAVYGFEWRGNIFVSYAFLVAWYVEAIRWRGDPSRAEPRSRLALWLWRGFFFVIISNAAIVFATTSMTRAFGVVLVGILVWTWWPGRSSVMARAHPPELGSQN